MSGSDTRQMQTLDAVIRKAGGIVKFCGELNITHQAVNGYWRKKGHVPLAPAVRIQRIWGVPARDLVADNIVDLLDD